MRREILVVSAALGCVACAAPAAKPMTTAATAPGVQASAYPETRKQEIVEQKFGVPVRDPYRWLEDAKSDEVQKWMAAQDGLARKEIDQLPGRTQLRDRLKALYYVDSISAPSHKGTRYFYSRTHADREKAIIYWREGEAGEEHVLLDPNQMSKDGSTSLGTIVASYDGKHLAYALHTNNSDEATLHVLEVASGKVSDVDVIEGGKYAQPSWTPTNDGFYYTWLPAIGGEVTVANRPGFAEVRFHKLGTDPKTDKLIHPKTGNAATFLGADLSRDGHWLFVYLQHGWNTSDVYYRDMRGKDPKLRPLAVGIPAIFEVEAYKDRFYIRTNDGAPRWRLFRTDAKTPERAVWKEIVPESREAVLDGVQIAGGQLVLSLMRNAISELEVHDLDGKLVRKVELPGIGATTGVTGNQEDDTAYFAFNSFTQPTEIWKTSIKAGGKASWAKVTLPIDASPYTIEQVWYPSKDGTRVSMFVVHRKDLKHDGSTPFLLYGYGGFSVNMLPSFSSGIYPWLEAGGGYAVPNLRGGGEYGEDWHKAGMLQHKQNVFDDFAAAAEFLVKSGYTGSDRLAIRGGSNGGLLVGAAMTQRPDLYRAVVCSVPLLDMVRFHLFGSGRTWVPEYGSADDETGFKTLYAYSPYHHVRPGVYPALLMLSADSDDRVDPMHARKMVAALQAEATARAGGKRPVLLRIEKHAGHGGADLVRQAVEQSADAYAFLMSQLGMTPKTP
jgi:prolyl oligopeptidase